MQQEMLDIICEQLIEYRTRFNNTCIKSENICKVKYDLKTIFQEICMNYSLNEPRIIEKSLCHFYISIVDGFEELITQCYIDNVGTYREYIDVQYKRYEDKQ